MSILQTFLSYFRKPTTISTDEMIVEEYRKVSFQFYNRDFFREQKLPLEAEHATRVDTIIDHIKKHYGYITEQKNTALDNLKQCYKKLPEYGLALSGGGIRSAAFATGVIQALHCRWFCESNKPTVFDKVMFLSTSSGGGYAGSALTWFLRKFAIFPFGSPSAAETTPEKHELSNKVLNFIRQHGNYLTPPGISVWSLISSVIISAVHSLIAYTLLLSIILFSVIYIVNLPFVHTLFDGILALSPDLFAKLHALLNTETELGHLHHNDRLIFGLFFLLFALLCGITYFVSLLLAGISGFFANRYSLHYGYRIGLQLFGGRLLQLGAVCLLFTLLPLTPTLIHKLVLKNLNETMAVADMESWLLGTGGLAGIGAIISAILEFRTRLSATTEKSSILNTLIQALVMGGFAFLILVCSFLLAERLYDISLVAHSPVFWLIFFSLIFCLFVNLNNISPHRMYRDRLMDTFLSDPYCTFGNSLANKGKQANTTCLWDLDQNAHWSPHHLINTNLILNNSKNPKYLDRLGDNFILSSTFCGSAATGYVDTQKFAFGKMTLATAISISGAATNPHAGVSGMGSSTKPLTSFLMTFFGLRLGYWVNNPNHLLTNFKSFFKPNYILPGASSLLDFGHTEASPYIELSDGGHFDNTGIYELIRRRLPWIILSDGSADADFTFEDLGNAFARIRIDFGVNIRFLDDYGIDGLIPNTSPDDANTLEEKYSLAQRGFAIGDIIYPKIDNDRPAFVGTFIYIKATLTNRLPGDLYAYKANNRLFPHEPTADQFFNERQFESYRELGYQLTKNLLMDKKAMDRLA
jgi:hypothetical protein